MVMKSWIVKTWRERRIICYSLTVKRAGAYCIVAGVFPAVHIFVLGRTSLGWRSTTLINRFIGRFVEGVSAQARTDSLFRKERKRNFARWFATKGLVEGRYLVSHE